MFECLDWIAIVAVYVACSYMLSLFCFHWMFPLISVDEPDESDLSVEDRFSEN